MANPIRTSKVMFAVSGYDAASGAGSYVFDTASAATLFSYTTAAIANGVANTVIQNIWVVPQRLEIVKIWAAFVPGANYSTTTTKFNIVKGDGAETGASGTGWAVQGAGNSVFAADKAFGAASYTGATFNTYGPFYPDTMTAWYDTGDLLTLRFNTGAGAAQIANNFLVISALVLPVDALPGKRDAGSVTAPNF